MNDGELVRQSIEFSVSLINFYKWLAYEKHEFVMSKQILRSGTSIGANLHESIFAISKADIINKIHISLKEASETEYWLIVLERSGYLTKDYYILKSNCHSLKKMLIATLKTAKSTFYKKYN